MATTSVAGNDDALCRQREKLVAAAVASLRCSHADAEDLVQQAYEKLASAASDGILRNAAGQLVDDVESWLFRVIVNQHRDRWRRAARNIEASWPGDNFDAPDHGSADPERLAIVRQAVTDIRVAIANLPRGQRDVVALRGLDELDYVEIAKQLRITPGAARVQWSRAVKTLRQMGFRL